MTQLICWVLRTHPSNQAQGGNNPLIIEYWQFVWRQGYWCMPLHHVEESQIVNRDWNY